MLLVLALAQDSGPCHRATSAGRPAAPVKRRGGGACAGISLPPSLPQIPGRRCGPQPACSTSWPQTGSPSRASHSATRPSSRRVAWPRTWPLPSLTLQPEPANPPQRSGSVGPGAQQWQAQAFSPVAGAGIQSSGRRRYSSQWQASSAPSARRSFVRCAAQVRPQFCTHVQITHIRVENPHDSPSTNGIVIDSCQSVEARARTALPHGAPARRRSRTALLPRWPACSASAAGV